MPLNDKQVYQNICAAIDDIRIGKMVVVVDDEDRENEGDLVAAAEPITAETVNFMATHGRGLICMPMIAERLKRLDLPAMVPDGTDHLETAFTISIDAQTNSTGISAHDRADTIKLALQEDTKPSDFRRPGHIFPLRAREGGVLVRAGHTEAAVDLAILAGLYPAGVICEIMGDDGHMSRLPELRIFAEKHDLKIISIQNLIAYRKLKQKLINRVIETPLETSYGTFRMMVYGTMLDDNQHIALIMGDVNEAANVLVRVHSECLTGDIFHSRRCDCGDQLDSSLQMIATEGRGVLLYMRQEGRGIGLVNKLRAYRLQDKGLDTVQANRALGFKADLRDYGIGAQILSDLGLSTIRLITNNPRKIVGLEGYGLSIVERLAVKTHVHESNEHYLKTKKQKMGHLIEGV